MKSLDDFPDEDIVPPNTWMEEDSIRAATIEKVSKYVVDSYVDLETVFKESDEVTEPGTSYDYTCEVISPWALVSWIKRCRQRRCTANVMTRLPVNVDKLGPLELCSQILRQ